VGGAARRTQLLAGAARRSAELAAPPAEPRLPLQMLNVVFQRMEADSVSVAIKPIAVADVLGLSRGAGQDGSSVALAVQVGAGRRPRGSLSQAA
jgi:hypothetical protein